MKSAVFALIVSVCAYTESLYALCKTEACKRAVAWKNGYTAIVLAEDVSRADYFAVLDAVRAGNGVVAIEAERVFLGWVPPNAAGRIRATRGVRAVFYEAAGRPADLVKREDALSALSFFNRVVTGEFEDVVEAGLGVTGEPLTGCGVHRTAGAEVRNSSLRSDATNRELRSKSSPRPGGVSPNFWYRTPYQNPDMRGRVTVQLFRVDSDGTVDPNLHTWTTTDFRFAREQIYAGFTFWVNEAAARNVNLSFRLATMDPFSRYTRNYVPTRTKYEPITRPSSDDYLWVNDALAYAGYGASPVTNENVYTRNEALNRDKAADPVYGPFDRSYSVYVVYNPGSAPDRFTNGQNAYAMFDGPLATVLWNSGGWGPANINRVFTHETGHIFWACDEYYGSCPDCNNCFFSGPRNIHVAPHILNANCDASGSTSACFPPVACVMKDNSHALCAHTPGQIGW